MFHLTHAHVYLDKLRGDVLFGSLAHGIGAPVLFGQRQDNGITVDHESDVTVEQSLSQYDTKIKPIGDGGQGGSDKLTSLLGGHIKTACPLNDARSMNAVTRQQANVAAQARMNEVGSGVQDGHKLEGEMGGLPGESPPQWVEESCRKGQRVSVDCSQAGPLRFRETVHQGSRQLLFELDVVKRVFEHG